MSSGKWGFWWGKDCRKKEKKENDWKEKGKKEGKETVKGEGGGE